MTTHPHKITPGEAIPFSPDLWLWSGWWWKPSCLGVLEFELADNAANDIDPSTHYCYSPIKPAPLPTAPTATEKPTKIPLKPGENLNATATPQDCPVSPPDIEGEDHPCNAPTVPPGTTGEPSLRYRISEALNRTAISRSICKEEHDCVVEEVLAALSTPPTTPGEPTDGEIDLKRLHRIGQYVRSKNIICHEYPIETVPLDEREKKQVGELNALFHELFGAAQPAEDTRRLEEVRAILEAAPELNMANYSHEQVRELNDAVIEAVLLIRAAMEASK